LTGRREGAMRVEGDRSWLAGPAWSLDDRITILQIAGKDAQDLLHRLSANDLSRMRAGDVCPAPLLTEKGRIIDILAIIHAGDVLLGVSSASQTSRVMQWIERFTIMEDVRITDVTSLFSVYWCADMGLASSSSTSNDRVYDVPVIGPEPLMDRVRRLLVPRKDPRKQEISGSVSAAILEEDLQISAEERNFRSIVMGIPSAPDEINEAHTPYDINLRHLISFTKGCYIGQEVIARMDTYGKATRSLMGVLLRAPAQPTPPVRLQMGDHDVGTLTSVAAFATNGKTPGLAILRNDRVHEGDRVSLPSGGEGVVCPLPITL
jgi:folate-binding protein YgfZ